MFSLYYTNHHTSGLSSKAIPPFLDFRAKPLSQEKMTKNHMNTILCSYGSK